tara:strand:+ start:6800 stop:7060 length:261 start_codon:yes stop_codon:yes gene_type:complete
LGVWANQGANTKDNLDSKEGRNMNRLDKKNTWEKELDVAQRKLRLQRLLTSQASVEVVMNVDKVTLSTQSLKLSKIPIFNKSSQLD